jgi:hypothetical protein
MRGLLANCSGSEFRYNSSVRFKLKEATTSNEQADDETARIFKSLYNPRGTGRCSDPLYRFLSEYDDILQAFFFTVLTAARFDEVRTIAARALALGQLPKDAQVEPADIDKDWGKGEAFKRVQKFSPLFSRNLVVGMANNFFSYVSEMLQHVLRRKPEVLRSSERLTNEEVLQFTRVKELIAYMADKKVNELAYGGLRGVEEYVKDRLGIAMFDNEDERIKLTILAELRNIHTHNRGIVNEIFLKRVGQKKYGDFDFTLDETTHVDFEKFVILSRNAIDVAMRLDANLGKKFGVRRMAYGKRLSAKSENGNTERR